MPRIVSLLASATEIVCALGFESDLVGRSHECDFPGGVRRLPAVTEPKFPVEGSSYEIDQKVKAVLQEAASVYRVDAALLKELRPDVIVTQTQCEVCAVSEKDVESAVCHWLGSRPTIVSLHPDALADVWADILRVGDALGVTDRARTLVNDLQGRMQSVADRSAALPDRPTVACVEWIDPLMAAGNWMPELVAMAGGDNLFGVAGGHAPWLSWAELRDRDPDVLLILPCGFDIPRTRAEMAHLSAKPDWPTLKAVRTGRVYLADGNQYFNRPGPRLAESLEVLAEILRPEVFAFGHEGSGWEKFAG